MLPDAELLSNPKVAIHIARSNQRVSPGWAIAEKAEVDRSRASVCSEGCGIQETVSRTLPPTYGFPIIAGRSVVWPSRFVSRDCEPFKMGIGTPFCIVTIPSIDHPPSQRLPLKIGSS